MRLLEYSSPRWHPDAGPVDVWLQRWMDSGWRHVPPSMGGSTTGVPVNVGGIDYLTFQLVRDPELPLGEVIPHNSVTLRALEQPDPWGRT